MTLTVAEKRAAFRRLHEQGCFVLPNPWDAGSARMLQHLGFAALASTSSGYAWSRGRPDNQVSRDDVLQHLQQLCAAVELPVNADFEGGFAHEPEAVAANVRLAIDTGVAGLSIEDMQTETPFTLYDEALALQRIRAARAAIDASGADVLLVARTEGLLHDASQISAAIDRLVKFAEAGADCLYAPGVQDPADIAAMVKAVGPKPLNVLMTRPGLSVAQLADLGVRRISVGGALARVAWAAMMEAAQQMQAGSFDGLSNAASGKQMNAIFGDFI